MNAAFMSPSPRVMRFQVVALNINAVADNAIIGLPAKYRVSKILFHDTSATLAVSIAVIGLFTAAAGAGTNLVTSVVTGLTSAAVMVSQTLAADTVYQTANTLYLRPTTAHGSAATINVTIFVEDVS